MKTKFQRTVGSSLMGLAIIGLAFATSAFTQGQKVDEPYIVNAPDGFELETSYDQGHCTSASNEACGYKILSPENLPENQTNFTPSEVADYLAQGWIEETDEKGEYVSP